VLVWVSVGDLLSYPSKLIPQITRSVTREYFS